MKLKIYFVVTLSLLPWMCNAQDKKEIEVGVFPFSYIYTYQPAKDEIQNRWGSLKTIAAGSLLGGLFGTLNYMSDKAIFPLNWYIFSQMRNKIIKDIINNADAQSESIEPSLFFNSAWMSDWFAYILAYRIMHGSMSNY